MPDVFSKEKKSWVMSNYFQKKLEIKKQIAKKYKLPDLISRPPC